MVTVDVDVAVGVYVRPPVAVWLNVKPFHSTVNPNSPTLTELGGHVVSKIFKSKLAPAENLDAGVI